MSANTPVQMPVHISEHVNMRVRLDARIGVRRYARNVIRVSAKYILDHIGVCIIEQMSEYMPENTSVYWSATHISAHHRLEYEYMVEDTVYVYIYEWMNARRTVRDSRRYVNPHCSRSGNVFGWFWVRLSKCETNKLNPFCAKWSVQNSDCQIMSHHYSMVSNSSSCRTRQLQTSDWPFWILEIGDVQQKRCGEMRTKLCAMVNKR